MARANKSIYAILGMLTHQSMSAYEMKRYMANNTYFFWNEREGQLYPTLKKLAADNLVNFIEKPAAKIGTKKVYSITSKGKQTLKDWFSTDTSGPTVRNELLLKLYFSKQMSLKDKISQLQDYIYSLDEQQSTLEKYITDSVNQTDVDMKNAVYQFEIAGIVAKHQWAVNLISKLKNTTTTAIQAIEA